MRSRTDIDAEEYYFRLVSPRVEGLTMRETLKRTLEELDALLTDIAHSKAGLTFRGRIRDARIAISEAQRLIDLPDAEKTNEEAVKG